MKNYIAILHPKLQEYIKHIIETYIMNKYIKEIKCNVFCRINLMAGKFHVHLPKCVFVSEIS